MRVYDFIWLPDVVEKLEAKHQVRPEEVEEVFESGPRFRFIAKGRRHRDENLYAAYGQTDSGRYLTVLFILKRGGLALIVSARDMDSKERKWYGKG